MVSVQIFSGQELSDIINAVVSHFSFSSITQPTKQEVFWPFYYDGTEYGECAGGNPLFSAYGSYFIHFW